MYTKINGMDILNETRPQLKLCLLAISLNGHEHKLHDLADDLQIL